MSAPHAPPANRDPAGADDDLHLVRRACGGDVRAFDLLTRKYQGRIYAFCLHLVHNVEEAEELTQDVFIKLFANLPSFRADAKFSTWLYQIAKNLSLNKLKHLKRRRYYQQTSLDARREDGEAGLEVRDEAKNIEALFEDIELQTLIQQKIDALREDYRRMLILRDVEGLSYDEIARRMRLTAGTVKSRLHKARLALRESLLGYFQ
jgi:RNA polymerase sigma-70 factor (ECF subfamily)